MDSSGKTATALAWAKQWVSDSAPLSAAGSCLGRSTQGRRIYPILQPPISQRPLLIGILQPPIHLRFTNALLANRAESVELLGRQHTTNAKLCPGAQTYFSRLRFGHFARALVNHGFACVVGIDGLIQSALGLIHTLLGRLPLQSILLANRANSRHLLGREIENSHPIGVLIALRGIGWRGFVWSLSEYL
jgi:hypothetical protein